MEHEVGSRTGRARRYLLALALAALLALGAAVPVFAQEEPTDGGNGGEDGGVVQPQVVGGEPVPDNKYKFMATVRDVTQGNTAYRQHFCGGTLIDRNSVLTAAHCMETRAARQLQVTVGRTVLTTGRGQTRSVRKIYRHPRYTNSFVSFRYDAAILRLNRPVKNIRPVRIPAATNNSFETPGRLLTIAGWGNTVRQGPNFGQPDRYPSRMQEAEVPVVSDAEAESRYTTRYEPRLMVAAGRQNRDTCQGDSGGPMFERVGGIAYQVGITSFGVGCGTQNYPGVYAETNSPNIRNFIFNAAKR